MSSPVSAGPVNHLVSVKAKPTLFTCGQLSTEVVTCDWYVYASNGTW